MSDRELLELFGTDPENALETVMERYINLVTHVVRLSLIPPFSEEDVDECVSDVFVKFYNSVTAIDPEKGSIRSYLCTVAKNRAIDFRRSNPYDRIASSLDAELTEQEEISFCTEDSIGIKEQREALARAIAGLPELDRQIIVRKYYYLEKTKDIARVTGLSANAVDLRAFKALKKLKKQLGGDFLE